MLFIGVIGIIFMLVTLYCNYNESQLKLKKEQEKKEIQRKAEEEQIAKENEHREKILNLQEKWKGLPIFQTALDNILTFVNRYEKEIEGFLTEGYDDVVCVVISNSGIIAYHYKGAHGYGTSELCGISYEWHYEKSGLKTIYEIKLNEQGYFNLDEDQKTSLSNVFNETFIEKFDGCNINLTNEYGFIVLDFKNCYRQLQSI